MVDFLGWMLRKRGSTMGDVIAIVISIVIYTLLVLYVPACEAV